jgi:hypothetical protein
MQEASAEAALAGRSRSGGWFARPPAWGFYSAFALVSVAIFMGSTELHDWGGTNLPNTGSELLGILGWWVMALVLAPVWLVRFVWSAASGSDRPTRASHPVLRWMAAPVIVALLGVVTVTEVIPRATRHYALADPADNRLTAGQVLQDALGASGVAEDALEPVWSTDRCDSYPSRQADVVEIEFRGLNKAEADLAMQRIEEHWSQVAAGRGWAMHRNYLDGDHFDFSFAWVFNGQRTQVLVLTGRTPCTRRS